MALPIGIISAVKQYSKLDYTVTLFSFFGISMPTFWFGWMLIILFAVKFKEWGLPYLPPSTGLRLRRWRVTSATASCT